MNFFCPKILFFKIKISREQIINKENMKEHKEELIESNKNYHIVVATSIL